MREDGQGGENLARVRYWPHVEVRRVGWRSCSADHHRGRGSWNWGWFGICKESLWTKQNAQSRTLRNTSAQRWAGRVDGKHETALPWKTTEGGISGATSCKGIIKWHWKASIFCVQCQDTLDQVSDALRTLVPTLSDFQEHELFAP